VDQIGRSLDGHRAVACGHDRQIVEIVDDDLLDIGARRDDDRVAIMSGVDRRLDGGEAAGADEQNVRSRPEVGDLDSDERVDAVRAGGGPVAAVGDEGGAGAQNGCVDAVAAVDIVVAEAAAQRVVAVAAVEDVVAGGAEQGVAVGVGEMAGTGVGVDIVGQVAAVQVVVARAAEDHDQVVAVADRNQGVERPPRGEGDAVRHRAEVEFVDDVLEVVAHGRGRFRRS
jgi:hypothetical protein